MVALLGHKVKQFEFVIGFASDATQPEVGDIVHFEPKNAFQLSACFSLFTGRKCHEWGSEWDELLDIVVLDPTVDAHNFDHLVGPEDLCTESYTGDTFFFRMIK
jgi:hypothetical protein